ELFGGNTLLAGTTGDPMEELVEFIEKIPAKDLPQISPYASVLVFTYQFVWHLALKGAFIPQILQVSEKKFRLRWIPALLDESVKDIFRKLAEAVPGDLIKFQTAQKHLYTSREEQIFWLCSSFFEWIILEHIPADVDNPVGDLFFLNFDFHIRKFEDEQTPYSIQQWLQRFYLHQRDYTLVLKIEEIDEFFGLSMFIEDKKNPLNSLVSLHQLFEEEELEAIRLSVLQDLALLAEYFEPVKKMIESRGKHQPRMGSIAFIPVLTRSIPLLKLLGVKVLLPKSLRKIAYPQLSVQLDSKESPVSAQSFLNLDEMLNFNWQVAIGDQLVDPYDFLNKVQGLSGLVKIYDTYVMLDQKEMQALLKKLKDPPELSHADLLKTGLTESFEDAKVKLSAKARSIIQSLLESEEIAPPQGLMANLRPYQQRGYEWMYKNAKIGFGSLLADDMGLGKTIQVISLLQQMKEEGQLEKRKGLIVVPTTLLTNWKNEIHKFAPELLPSIYHGPNRQLDIANSDLIITTYGVIRSDLEALKKIKWAILIIDEAQNIKNPGTIQSKSIKRLKAQTRVALSGTPVENRLSEYWSIFDFVNKGYLKTLTSF
ncbi:MAG: DEAD/DEAH box helicase, partial [Bacteroidetes bacterium]|nr:DEAD/DEAH box helicase [Bacteroidota bacterium]